jgi:hypothetical protein
LGAGGKAKVRMGEGEFLAAFGMRITFRNCLRKAEAKEEADFQKE